MPDNRLIEYHRRESPAYEPHFLQEVAFPVLAAAFATYCIFAVAYDHATGQGLAGGAMLIMLGWRLWQWDRNGRPMHIVERRQYIEAPQLAQEGWNAVMVTTHGDGNGHTWTIGRWTFKDSEWRRLWQVLETGTITRDKLAEVTLDSGERMFPSITRHWRDGRYQREFRRLGWVDEDNNVLPAARIAFQERNLTHYPANNES